MKDEKLWKILDNVNKWLEYAEKKNALILTFIGLQITFVNIYEHDAGAIEFVSLFVLGACFLLTLISFYPKTKIPRWATWLPYSEDSPLEDDNLLFFGHIVKYSSSEYIVALEKKFNESLKGEKYYEDICSQIVVNSQIVNAKYQLFKINFWLIFVGQILLFSAFV
ncbi:MAG: hypothetical protein D3925_00255 [Candidatus Electrothrix sp. AR5]|nr:hypothetical protein [Candidatus Electrothrix sp. AR5]